jgi:hypothetical protein
MNSNYRRRTEISELPAIEAGFKVEHNLNFAVQGVGSWIPLPENCH